MNRRVTCVGMVIQFALFCTLTSFLSGKGDPDRAALLLAELQNGPVSGRSHILLEEDLNAYIARELLKQPLRGINDLSIKLNQGTFSTFLILNLDEVRLDENHSSLQFIRGILEGTQRLKVEGILAVEDGVATYETKNSWLNDLPVPAFLVDAILSSVGRSQRPPFDPTKPFEAPFGIQELRLLPEQAILVK